MKRWLVLLAMAAAGACSSARPGSRPSGVAPTSPTVAPTPLPSPVTPHPARAATVVSPPAPVVSLQPARTATAPPRIRILLERTSKPFVFPQPGRPYRVSWNGEQAWVWGPLTVTPDPRPVWQVGAWSDPAGAASTIALLKKTFGDAIRIERSVGKDRLIRVSVEWMGPDSSGFTAKLEALGLTGVFRTGIDGLVRLRDMVGTGLEAHHISLKPAGSWPTAAGSKRYRGWFDLRFSNGTVLVINELNIEAYLRGVVPAEMGPSAFPQLAALKAQAVAARTYAVAHMGDHDADGYDLCATPACQVYGGVSVEHPLSDRAVRETAGLIAVFNGKPIDAMYTSTCGGHTEDAGVLFPNRAEPYLKGVACAWEHPLTLRGTGASSGWTVLRQFDAQLARRALDVGETDTIRRLIRALAKACGGTVSGPDPKTPETFAGELLDAAGLETAGAVLGGGGTNVQRLLHLADLDRIRLDPPPGVDWQRAWAGAAVLAALRIQGIVQQDRGEAVPRTDGVGIFPAGADASMPLPGKLPLYERWDGAVRRVVRADLLPGVTLERWRRGGDLLALVVVRSGGGAEADRRSRWRAWTRELSWKMLASRLGMRHLARIVVTRRSASGRVVGLAAFDRSGHRKTWTGFAVRQVLGLPETLFTFHTIRKPDGTVTVRFLGRGWGHGVGLCQNGAYGLARAGMTFDQILSTYYPGTSLAVWGQETAPVNR